MPTLGWAVTVAFPRVAAEELPAGQGGENVPEESGYGEKNRPSQQIGVGWQIVRPMPEETEFPFLTN